MPVAVVVLASCAFVAPETSPPAPPVIAWAGIPAEVRVGQTIVYRLADGGTIEVEPESYRLLTPGGWDGELVILGSDAGGQFVASFRRQAAEEVRPGATYPAGTRFCFDRTGTITATIAP